MSMNKTVEKLKFDKFTVTSRQFYNNITVKQLFLSSHLFDKLQLVNLLKLYAGSLKNKLTPAREYAHTF